MESTFERLPLAYGFISGGSVYFKVKYDFTDEFLLHNKLGKDLIDFTWFDEDLARDILDGVWGMYLKLKKRKSEYAFIVTGLLQRFEKSLRLNAYFSIYLLSFIDFLLDNKVDLRVFADSRTENVIAVTAAEIPDIEKREMIGIVLEAIQRRQTLIEQTLDNILASIASTNTRRKTRVSGSIGVRALRCFSASKTKTQLPSLPCWTALTI